MRLTRRSMRRTTALTLTLGLLAAVLASSARPLLAAGRMDMADLLDQILHEKSGGAPFSIQSAYDGRRLVVPIPGEGVFPPELMVPATAERPTATPDETLSFAVNEQGHVAFPSENFWEGEAIGNALPFETAASGAVNIAPLLSGAVSAERNLFLYGLTNATLAAEKSSRYLYSATNEAPGEVQFTLREVDNALDTQLNGIPDFPFTALEPGETWLSQVETGVGRKSVAVASLSAPLSRQSQEVSGRILLIPVEGVQVELPSAATLKSAGLVPEESSVLAVIAYSDNLAAIIDQVSGSGEAGARQAWAATMLSKAPAALVPAHGFLDISILYTTSANAFEEVENLEALGQGMQVSLARGPAQGNFQVWSLPTRVATGSGGEDVVVMDEPGNSSWSFISATPQTFTTDSLSVFAVFETGIALVGAEPQEIAARVDSQLRLRAFLPLVAAMSLEQASAAYRVYLGHAPWTAGMIAPFAPGTDGHAITPGAVGEPATVHVRFQAPAAPGPVDAFMTSLAQPANSDSLSPAFVALSGEEGEGEGESGGRDEGGSETKLARIAGIGMGGAPGTQIEVFAFGGVVAQISGDHLTPDTRVTIGSAEAVRPATVLRAGNDGTTLDFVVPPTGDASPAAHLLADVTVSSGSSTASTLPAAIKYLRRKDTSGTVITAYSFAAGGGTSVSTAWGKADAAERIELSIPALTALDAQEEVHGILLARTLGAAEESGPDPLSVTTLIEAGEAIPGSVEFGVHLYRARPGPLRPGEAALEELPLLNFPRTLNAASSTPEQEGAAAISFPLSASGLTGADVRKGLSFWGIQSTYDYLHHETLVDADAPRIAYQSQLLVGLSSGDTSSEVEPAVPAGAPDALAIRGIVNARLYQYNSFSLRRGAALPAELATQVRVGTDTGTSNGPASGGTILRIVSPLGGLAWVDRIEFSNAATGALLATQTDFVTPRGSNEYELVLSTPATASAAVANLNLFLRSAPTQAAIKLPSAFEYKATGGPGVLMALLGLLVALLSLFSGGSTAGSGGGGPCFIATAAYGTPLAGEIEVLRAVRDEYLLSNPFGTAFVDAYYQISPSLAPAVASHPALRRVVQCLLLPVVLLARMLLVAPMPCAGLLCIGLGCYHYSCRKRRAKA